MAVSDKNLNCTLLIPTKQFNFEAPELGWPYSDELTMGLGLSAINQKNKEDINKNIYTICLDEKQDFKMSHVTASDDSGGGVFDLNFGTLLGIMTRTENYGTEDESSKMVPIGEIWTLCRNSNLL